VRLPITWVLLAADVFGLGVLAATWVASTVPDPTARTFIAMVLGAVFGGCPSGLLLVKAGAVWLERR
jgi:hypothetical protein